jgi:hypothetical protein
MSIEAQSSPSNPIGSFAEIAWHDKFLLTKDPTSVDRRFMADWSENLPTAVTHSRDPREK